jgi:2-phosphosulfolactate phosphatase
MRPAIEDWIGAGAIVHYMQGTCSPEARSAQAAFLNAKDALTGILRQCSSGRELIERGFGIDIEYAAALNTSEAVPLLRDGYYSDHRPSSSVD